MILREPTIEDISYIFDNLRTEDQETIDRLGGAHQMRLHVMQMTRTFPSQVFVQGDTPVAIFIVLRRWEGVAEVCAYTTTDVEKYRIGFYRACIRGIDYCRDILGMHRLDAIVWGNYYRSIKWLLKLGFSVEGFRPKYGPDKEDATMLGRVM